MKPVSWAPCHKCKGSVTNRPEHNSTSAQTHFLIGAFVNAFSVIPRCTWIFSRIIQESYIPEIYFTKTCWFFFFCIYLCVLAGEKSSMYFMNELFWETLHTEKGFICNSGKYIKFIISKWEFTYLSVRYQEISRSVWILLIPLPHSYTVCSH